MNPLKMTVRVSFCRSGEMEGRPWGRLTIWQDNLEDPVYKLSIKSEAVKAVEKQFKTDGVYEVEYLLTVKDGKPSGMAAIGLVFKGEVPKAS